MRPRPVDPQNTDDPPECVAGCRYLMKYDGFALQKNALRSELASMVDPIRCGWNLKPDCIGGHPLDYAPCVFTAHSGRNMSDK